MTTTSPNRGDHVDFEVPAEIQATLDELDAFIEAEIKPPRGPGRQHPVLRPPPRVGPDRLRPAAPPEPEWEALLPRCAAGPTPPGGCAWPCPKEYGGRSASNLGMAIIREHLAHKGLGLHNDLQNEHSIVGNNVGLLLMRNYGTESRRPSGCRRPPRRPAPLRLRHHRAEPRLRRHPHGDHRGRDGDEWVINGEKRWNSGIHHATHDMVFARTSG
jgi:acyl-CoA dehydrogenase